MHLTLSDLGNLGDFIGALAVVASLIYVGLELRRNTRTLRAQAHETMVSGYLSTTQMFAEHAAILAKGMVSSPEEFQGFPASDKVVFFATMFAFHKHFEQMYAQYRRGFIEEGEWQAWSEHILMQFHQPGPQWWWKLRRTSFAEPFRRYLDTSKPPQMLSMAQLLRDEGEGHPPSV